MNPCNVCGEFSYCICTNLKILARLQCLGNYKFPKPMRLCTKNIPRRPGLFFQHQYSTQYSCTSTFADFQKRCVSRFIHQIKANMTRTDGVIRQIRHASGPRAFHAERCGLDQQMVPVYYFGTDFLINQVGLIVGSTNTQKRNAALPQNELHGQRSAACSQYQGAGVGCQQNCIEHGGESPCICIEAFQVQIGPAGNPDAIHRSGLTRAFVQGIQVRNDRLFVRDGDVQTDDFRLRVQPGPQAIHLLHEKKFVGPRAALLRKKPCKQGGRSRMPERKTDESETADISGQSANAGIALRSASAIRR